MQPTRITIAARSGKVRVIASRGATLAVDGARMTLDDDGAMRIDGRSDAVTVHCPEDTDVTIGTFSGRVDCAGRLGAMKVTTASGRVSVERCTSIDLRTKSGRVDVETCEGHCRIVAAASTVTVRSAGSAEISTATGTVVVGNVGDAEIRVISGKVSLATQRGTHVKVRAVSGTVTVMVPRDARPATRLRAISGSVRCEPERGDDGEITIDTVSGTIAVKCSP